MIECGLRAKPNIYDDAVVTAKDVLESINLITDFRHSKDWPKIESKLKRHGRSNSEIIWRKQKHRSRIFNRLYKEQSNNIFNLVDMAVEAKLKETFMEQNYFNKFVDIKDLELGDKNYG